MINYILIGNTGVGKSSFINNYIGKQVAKTGKYKEITKDIKRYTIQSRNISLIDLPGLNFQQDSQTSSEAEQRNVAYLRKLIEVTNQLTIHGIIYVTAFHPRLSSAERETLRLIAKELPNHYWKNSMIVFTRCAGRLDTLGLDKFESGVQARCQEITDYLKKENKNFSSFERIILVDNVNFNWHENAREISESLDEKI
jgi:GTP-binding protein EngB required for normal cell division